MNRVVVNLELDKSQGAPMMPIILLDSVYETGLELMLVGLGAVFGVLLFLAAAIVVMGAIFGHLEKSGGEK